MNGGTRRHRKVLRDNIKGVTKPAIRRLCRRGGVKRLSGLIYEEARGVLKVFLENVIRDSVTYTEHSRRKTVIATDVIYALKKQGRDLYGFGGYAVHGTVVKKRKKTHTTSSLNDANTQGSSANTHGGGTQGFAPDNTASVPRRVERKKTPSSVSGRIPYDKKLTEEMKEIETFMRNEMEDMMQKEMEKIVQLRIKEHKERKKQELLKKLNDSVGITRRKSSPIKISQSLNTLPKRKSAPATFATVYSQRSKEHQNTEAELPEENVTYEDPSQFDFDFNFDFDNETQAIDNILSLYNENENEQTQEFEPLSEMKLPLACKRNFNLCFNLGINLSYLSSIDFDSVIDITKQHGSWKKLKVTYAQRDTDLKIKTVVHTYDNDEEKKFAVLEYFIGRFLPFLEVTPNLIPMIRLLQVRPDYLNILKKEKKIDTLLLQNCFEQITTFDIDANESYYIIACYTGQQTYSTETLLITNTVTLSEILERDDQRRKDFLLFDMIGTFFQIYSFLYIYQDIFTHNNLQNEDILLFYVPNTVFHFSYEFEDKKVQFETHYLVKITNFRTCYLHGVTDKLWNKMDRTVLPTLNRSRDVSFLFNLKKNEAVMNKIPYLDYVINKIYYTGEEYKQDHSENYILTVTDVFKNLFDIIDNTPTQAIPNKKKIHYQIKCQCITQEEFENKRSDTLVSFDFYYNNDDDKSNEYFSKNITDNIVLAAKRYKHIEVLCKNVDFCIHFGIATKPILDFLSRYKHFDHVSSVRTLDTFNVNSNIHLLESSLANIVYTTVLKSYKKQPEKNKFSDNLLYEYFTGKRINRFKITPHFVETLNIYKYPSFRVAVDFMNQRSPQPSYLKSILTKLEEEEVYDNLEEHIRESCKDPYLFCVESLYATNTIIFSHFFDTIRQPRSIEFWKSFGITTFYQIFSSLIYYYNIFSHNDLHYGNILLCYEPGYHFRFVYSMPSKNTDVIFYSPYLVKIIDYARCYIHDFSRAFISVMKQIEQCANKNTIHKRTGYYAVNRYFNKHTRNDRTEDLRMLNFIKQHQIPIPLADGTIIRKIHEGYKSIVEFFHDLERHIVHNPQVYLENQLHLFANSKVKGTFIVRVPNSNSRDYESLMRSKNFYFLSEEERLRARVTFLSREVKEQVWETKHFFYIKEIDALTNYDFTTTPDFFTYELLLEPEKFLEYKTVLKFHNKSKALVLYEWYIGIFVNKFTRSPNTVETLNLYETNGPLNEEFKNRRADSLFIQRYMRRVKDYKKIKKRFVSDDGDASFCLEHSMYIHYANMMYIPKKNIPWDNDYVFCLFQAYSFLRTYQNVCTLHNFSLQSIVMCYVDEVKDKYHFRYVYKEHDKTVLEFYSPYIVRIVDYSKAYIKHHSEHILEDVLLATPEQQKNVKGLDNVLKNLKIDRQKDLSPLKFLKMYLTNHKQPDTVMHEAFQQLVRKVDTQDGIRDVESAYQHLKRYLLNGHQSSKLKGSLYGTFEINTDIIDSIHEITDTKSNRKNAFKFTLNY